MKIQTPHDKFFKETFGRVGVANDFLNNYLPQNIINVVDMDTLEPQKYSFIDKELKDIFADMLFKVNIDNKEGYKDLPEDIQKHIPDYEYLLYDISRFTDEEIKCEVINKIAMTTLRDIFTKDTEGIIESVYKMIGYLVELEDKQSGIEYFETLMRYIFSAKIDLTKEVANEIMNKIETTYPEGSEVVMTLAERFREEGMGN